MIKKKILTLILTVTLLFPATLALAAIPQENLNEFFGSLGILERTTEIGNEDAVTRGEFSVIVSNLINVGGISGAYTTSKFLDVAPGSKAFDAICLLGEMGIISGNGNGLFLPDAPILISEAATILVRIMGYEVWVQNGDYMSIAARKHLLDNVTANADGTLSKAAAERMMFNTLEADVSDSNTWDGEVVGGAEESYMSNRFGIYKVRGIVSDNGITSLTGRSEIKRGNIKLDGRVFENRSGNDDLLGLSVTGYYKTDRESGNDILLFAYVSESSNTVLKIDARDIESYKNNTFTFNIPGTDRTRTRTIEKGFKLIYNGLAYMPDKVASAEEFEDIMTPELGWVKIIDSATEGTVVIVKSYHVAVVGSADAANKIISDKLPTAKINESTGAAYDVYESFDFSDTDELVIKNKGNSELAFSSILPDNVVSIALSIDGTVGEIILSTDVVYGKIENILDESYIVDENEYEFSERFMEYLINRRAQGKDIPVAGDDVTLYLNHVGEVAFIKAGTFGGEFAYLDAVSINKSGINEDVSLRVVTQGKEIKVVKVAEKVTIDGVSMMDRNAVYSKLTGVDLQGNASGVDARSKIIKLTLDSEGKAKHIDIPYYSETGNPNAASEGENSLHVVSELGEFEQRWYSYRAASFEGIISVDADTVLFVVPDDTDDLKEILVTDFVTSFKSNIWRYPMAYSMEKDSMVADVVVLKEGASGIDVNNKNFSDSCPPYLVKKVLTAMNNDGELVTQLVLTQDGTEVTYFGTSDMITAYTHSDNKEYQVTPGDIIQFGYNKFGYINKGNLRILYDEETDSHLFTFAASDEAANRVNRKYVEIQKGWVNRVTPTHLEIATKNPATTELVVGEKLIYSLAPAEVLIYDRKTGSVSNGSTTDLISYEYSGVDCSEIALHNEGGTLNFVVIYK